MKANTALIERCMDHERRRLCVWGRTQSERQSLRRRVKSGDLVCVVDGCFARVETWNSLDPVERYRWVARTLAVLHPDWVFGGMTAAVMYGISDSIRHLGVFHIAMDKRRHGGDRGPFRYCLVPEDEYARYAMTDGVRVTPLGRTVFDCLRHVDFPDGIGLVESVLRQRMMTRDEMRTHCLSLPGRWRSRALLAVEQAPGGTDNGGEAYAYGVMIEEGFAAPRVQETVAHPDDATRYDRVDFAWHTADGRFIVAELDGRVKYRDPSMYVNGSLPDTIIAEKEREERIRLRADEVVRFSFSEAYRRRMLVEKLMKAGVPRVGV
ncbi:type IV toxin-antitoxin system AbiEi family antitoxin domain-containing protein [Bifidobacterium simiiventris]|uniref:type IV toxin-antitoxin system AbiEi family antitoxin domain-containing protein n=1 Tax=Bifidobacterium simiiventris TaxID=2834434 RepID=UPI001C57F151|nr:hypothetical protein [Bifidobacterium simiiventris]MBW3078602.1 hypothetical protein [Bifidobacterium simiiventris]